MRAKTLGGDVWRREGALELFGLPLSRTRSLDEAFALTRELFEVDSTRARLVTFANPLAIRIAASDSGYESDLRQMDLVFCDGIALALAARWIGAYAIKRVSFDSTSLAPRVFDYVRTRRLTLAFVGGRPGVAEVAAERIRANYPGIAIIAALDGYRPQAELIARLRQLDPQVVVCGMGAPRQEAFLAALARSGWRGVGCTCGGYFDHLGQRFHFYPALVDRLNLRWLYRLGREPHRIGYRCVVEYGPFWRALAGQLLLAAWKPGSRGRP
jgi:N-acetylglucosaminyldiphosphoundecaprenol N-acetyl-beta-D-mannosaminyltransferase